MYDVCGQEAADGSSAYSSGSCASVLMRSCTCVCVVHLCDGTDSAVIAPQQQ
jgi:hypothetical protein